MSVDTSADQGFTHGSPEWDQARRDTMRVSRDLEAEGRLAEAITVLAKADQSLRHPVIEHHLVRLRHLRSTQRHDSGLPPARWPQLDRVAYDIVDGLAQVQPENLNASVLRSAILGHGHLHVPGLFAPSRCEEFRNHIDGALDAMRRAVEDKESIGGLRPWYDPIQIDKDRWVIKDNDRKFTRLSNSMWLADSPRVMAEYLEELSALGIDDLLEDYLGAEPEMSIKKSVLRKVPTQEHTQWHQDGSFMGHGIKTVNIWLALSDCGSEQPGLDIVPRRLDDILETGTAGAYWTWSLADDVVEATLNGEPPLRPEFAAGDALFFDEVMLHRTAFGTELSGERHAIESWFFAPGECPDDQIPISM